MTITCELPHDRFRPILDRSTQRLGLDECWPWLGAVDADGYGSLRWGCACGSRHRSGSHRIAWVLEYGPIPDGLTVDHRCRVRWCQNPGHMQLATAGANAAARRSAATHCLYGHEFTPENTYWSATGYRTCKACSSAKHRLHNTRRRIQRGAPARGLLSERMVVAIRERVAAGETATAVALDLNLQPLVVMNVVRGRTYTRFGGPLRPTRLQIRTWKVNNDA